MWSVFLLIGIAFLGGLLGWFFFVRGVRRGQFDDMEGPKYRMLDDDDEEGGGKGGG